MIGLAEAGVGVAEQGERRRPGQHGGLLGELGEREQADIGQARPAGREGAAGEVDGRESEPLGQLGRQRVEGAGIMIGRSAHAARSRHLETSWNLRKNQRCELLSSPQCTVEFGPPPRLGSIARPLRIWLALTSSGQAVTFAGRGPARSSRGAACGGRVRRT